MNQLSIRRRLAISLMAVALGLVALVAVPTPASAGNGTCAIANPDGGGSWGCFRVPYLQNGSQSVYQIQFEDIKTNGACVGVYHRRSSDNKWFYSGQRDCSIVGVRTVSIWPGMHINAIRLWNQGGSDGWRYDTLYL